MAIVIIELRGN
ncbi:hypothetical protein D018_0760A, partial [Vibrio parahaemolyticus VP2007-007]